MQADSSFKATWSSSLLKEPPSVTLPTLDAVRSESSYLCCRFPRPRTTHASSCIIPPALTCCLQKARRTPHGHPSASHRGLKNQNKVLSLLPPAGWGRTQGPFFVPKCNDSTKWFFFFLPVGPEWLWQFAIRGTLCPNEWRVLVQYFHCRSELRFKSPFFCRDAFRPTLVVAQITNISLWQACVVIADVWQYHLINHKERDNRNYSRMANIIIYICLYIYFIVASCDIYIFNHWVQRLLTRMKKYNSYFH